MAQVKKFQNGGKTFKLAGYTFNTNNKEDMDMLAAMASDSKYGGIAQSVLDNVNDSDYTNTLNAYRTSDGRVVMEGELQKIKDKHMSSGTQKATSRKDNAFWNTVKRQSGKEWANNMDAFLSEISRRKSVAAPASAEETSSKIKVTGVHDLGGRWAYNEQGWNEADINNNAMLRRLGILEDYVKATEEERKNKYDISGLNQEHLNAFIDMYQKDPELFNKYKPLFTKDHERLSDDNDFYSTYGWFGFNSGVSDESYAQKVAEDKVKKAYQDSGWNHDQWKDYGTVNEDGSLELNAGVLGGYSNGNYMFNDYWANSKMNPGEEWLKGYTKIGNRLYKTSDAEKEGTALYNYLRRRGGFYDLNQSGDYEGSNSIINWMWGNPYYQNVDNSNIGNFHTGNYQYDPTNLRSDKTTWTDGELNEGDQIVRYLNMDDKSGDNLGFRTPLYGIVDKAGNLVQSGLSRDSFTNLFDGGTKEVMEAQQFLGRQRASNDPKSKYYNMYKETVGDESDPLFTFYIDPTTGESTMIPGSLLTNKTLGENVGIKNVGNTVRELLSDPKIINLIKTNPRFQKKLQNTIMSMTGSDWQDLFKGNFNRPKELMKFGLSEEEANTIINAFYDKGSNADNGRAYERKANYLDYVPSNKNGGTLKAQQGIVLNAGSKQAKSNIDVLDEKGESTKTIKHTEPGNVPGSQVLSRADIAELISAGADVVGTVTGLFGPIGDVAGSAIGLGASATQLGADISRDGFQLKDLGRFGLNAGLDAVGLIPVLGDAARTAKTLKTIKKVSKIASPLFIGMGLTAAAGSVDKILKGEQLTVEDWTNLASGFQSITNAGVLGKQRYDMSKIASLNSKLPKNTPEIQYKHKIGDKEVVLTKDQIGEVVSKNKADAQKYLAGLFEGVDQKDIPSDLVSKFGFKEGMTRWNKVSEQPKPKETEDRSALGFFVRPGLNKYIDANSKNIEAIANSLPKTITNTESGNNGVTVYRTESEITDKGLSRKLASLAKEYGVKLPISENGKTNWSTIKNNINETARITPTTGKVLSEAETKINNLPIKTIPDFIPEAHRYPAFVEDKDGYAKYINDATVDLRPQWNYSPKHALVSGPGSAKVSYTTPKERLSKARAKYKNKKTVEQNIIDNLMKKGYSISIPETSPKRKLIDHSIATDVNAVMKDWRNEFDIRSGSTKTSPEANTMDLFMRLNAYKQALNNVNSEKSFKKLMENMGKDIEFKLAMEENPGLLRQEMLNAAMRAGVMGNNRKMLLSDNELVFKKGGILKGKNGLWDIAKSLTSNANLSGMSINPDTGILEKNLDIPGMIRRSTLNTNYSESSLKPANIATNYSADHNNKHAQEWTKDVKLADSSSGRVSNNNFDWNYLAKETLGLANTAAAISDAYKFKQQSDKKADLYSLGQPSIWNGRGRMRFQTPTMNLANQQIAANNTIANTLNSSDSGVNLAGKLELAKMNSGVMDQANRQISQEYSNALNQHAATQREDDKLTFETANQARQYAMNAGLIRNAGETELTNNLGAIRDKYFNKLQSDISRFGLMDVSKQNRIDQLNLMKNQSGITANQIKRIDSQIAMINSPEYSNILRRQAMYGTPSAKKGTKLRSTTEQMLLDNNKIVAKAIEKLNDNTTKLILKALS